jgi:hypothetical protein
LASYVVVDRPSGCLSIWAYERLGTTRLIFELVGMNVAAITQDDVSCSACA